MTLYPGEITIIIVIMHAFAVYEIVLAVLAVLACTYKRICVMHIIVHTCYWVHQKVIHE
jgi:hypothetical protein